MSLPRVPSGCRVGLSPLRPDARRAGAALIIVLAFVVLLTGLIVAYFARSLTGRQLSNSSAGQTKSAALAQSASDVVISGLKAEIVAGSTPTPVGTSPNQSTIYLPKAITAGPVNANMVPLRFPIPPAVADPPATPAPDLIPNLVRRSMRDDSSTGASPIPQPAVPSLASAITSSPDSNSPTAERPINGRAISKARWNSHYLIPRAVGNTTDTDSTPDPAANFTAPDWVLVSRNGPAVQTSLGTGTTALSNPMSTNSNFVVGRYAYAIYDEGGLLDMNVAGHPTAASPAAPTSSPPVAFTATQVSQKGSLAMADLTQLPTVRPATFPDTNPNPSNYLTQAMVDGIVGWRNNASSGNPSGTFPNFTFSTSNGTNWFANFAYNNPSGFLKVYSGPAGASSTSTVPTDQAFLSRQQLLKLRSSLGFGANALQYMGTFSRAVDQPSYVPAHIQYPAIAPSINAVAQSTPPPAASVDSYLGNNNAAGIGFVGGVSKPGQDIINPSLLAIRATKTFNRFDLNKTPSVIGEPLLKKRFPLSRLSEIRYDATNATPSLTDPNFVPTTPSFATDKNHIRDWFGLTRTSASAPWTYAHGGVSGDGSGVGIQTLDKVATAGREPDFAELLKAAINAGSLAKGGPNLHNDQGNFQYVYDTSLDYQVLQIMANLIDQADSDSYPTVIRVAVGSGVYRTFRGVEDLPYFYRYHPFSVITKLPSPLLSKNTKESFTVPDKNPTRTLDSCEPLPSGGLTEPGNVVGLYIPEVWNPHDASVSIASQSSSSTPQRPNKFRLSVITDDFNLPALTPSWQAGIKSAMSADWYDDIPPKSSIPEAVKGLADPANPAATPPTFSSVFTFTDANGTLFREPTLLWHQNEPTGLNLTPENGAPGAPGGTSLAGPYTDANTNISYYGVQIGQGAISYMGTVDHLKYPANPQSPNDKYLFQATAANLTWNQPATSYLQYTFRLQYLDPNGSGTWITYDEKYPDFHGMLGSPLYVNKADYTDDTVTNPLKGGLSDTATTYDPRTPRFGVGTRSATTSLIALEPTTGVFSVLGSQRPYSDLGNQVQYSNPGMTSDPGKNAQMRWFSGIGFSASNGQDNSPNEYDGVLFGLNNPAVLVPQRKSGTMDQHLYYEDADGVARRAMGAYTYLPSGNILPAAGSSDAQSHLEGIPHATASSVGNGGTTTPIAQSLSRPVILNRPFRSVAEMSYASRGMPWKQLDFFTPESGDTALLDVFCANEVPTPDGVVAGKVNLNTHQGPVIQALAAGVARDELSNIVPKPSYAQDALTGPEAANVGVALVNITRDLTHAWRGPLSNVAELVGRYVNAPNIAGKPTDQYTFNETVTGANYTYAGFSAALDNSVFTSAPDKTARIQRLHESAIRALADSGQTRVWNLMIDVVAQTGRYPTNATTLGQFAVDGESRYWVHVAIDRLTGEVIDKQIELVSE